jgi:hypothetical protein
MIKESNKYIYIYTNLLPFHYLTRSFFLSHFFAAARPICARRFESKQADALDQQLFAAAVDEFLAKTQLLLLATLRFLTFSEGQNKQSQKPKAAFKKIKSKDKQCLNVFLFLTIPRNNHKGFYFFFFFVLFFFF